MTEKLDGTNAAIQIIPTVEGDTDPLATAVAVDNAGNHFLVVAQSRKRIIVPGADNAGFASWVHMYAPALVSDLGPGTHYGEWYGQGIQRNYGLKEKRLALFNTAKWGGADFSTPQLGTVPVLYQGPNDEYGIDTAFELLWDQGSYVSDPDWEGDPEGIVIYHSAANQVFKKTYVGDEGGKGQ